jgi:hypothetical protein
MRRIALATCLTAASLPAAAADLTLHRVMLSAAGVGYFEYGAHAGGPAAIGLDIPLSQVDDVLNSLAIFDDHGGVGTIDLPARDDSHAAFAGVTFTAETLDAPPLALLNALRGEEIDVGPPAAMTGRIVNALTEAVTTPQNTPRRAAFHTRVTLLTADGMRQFILEDATAIRFTDPGLRARVGAALDAARQQTAAAMRHLTLHSTGNGARDLTVGYVVAAPLWKATYRLILPAKPGDKARVQGWAVLENQSGADWKAVDLTLQSGNPVTFRQAIYASYYAGRPEVPVDVIGRILPDADQSETVPMLAAQGAVKPFRAGKIVPGAQRDLAASGASMASAYAPPPPAPALAEPATQTASTETLLDTTFHIATPVDLAQGHTASVPILDTPMPAEQLDWLQPYSTRPVSAVRLKNTGAASLPPGVLTLYTESAAGAAFAGDARLSGLPAGESRLLAFAEDLRLHATRDTSAKPAQLMHVSIAKGVLRRTLRDRVTYTVGLTAPPHEARRVLVEFPKNPDAAFSIEGAAIPGQETTATAWRVPIDLKAGETRRITAYADTTESTSETLLADDGSFDDALLAELTADGNLDPAARAALQPLIALRGALSDRQAAVKTLADQQAAVTADETRLQANLHAVFGPGDLHEKLLAELDADETTLGTLKTTLTRAQQEQDAAHAALADAAAKLEL